MDIIYNKNSLWISSKNSSAFFFLSNITLQSFERSETYSMQQLSRKQQLLVGFTLFSMFFGAGNLIFPPQLGAQAGVQTWPAMAGLAISAIGLPILGVIAVVRRAV